MKYKRQLGPKIYASLMAIKDEDLAGQEKKPPMTHYRLATVDQGRLRLKFDYDPALISIIKLDPRMAGRRWNPEQKAWYAPLTNAAIAALKELKFDLDESILDWERDTSERSNQHNKPSVPLPEGLFTFQQEDVLAASGKYRNRALIANDPGTGKTMEALAWLHIHPEFRPAIVVSPAKAKLNWRKHARNWLPEEDIVTLAGTQTEEDVRQLTLRHPRAVVLVNYDLLILPTTSDNKPRTLAEALLDLNPQAIVLDECHYAMNPKAQRSKAVKRLARQCTGMLAMSGTPATSRPAQYFHILNMLRPETFPAFFPFAMRYCAATHNRFGWDFSGASNTKELHDLLITTCMIRHRKQDVLLDLPPKLRDLEPIELDNRKEYDEAERDFVAWLRSKGKDEQAERASKAEALTRIEGLKLLAAQGKLASVKQWIQDFLDDSNEKLIVFTNHTEIRNALYEHFSSRTGIIQATGGNQTFKAAEKFQKYPEIRLIIGNIDAMGDAIDLFAASHVAFVELPWTPGKMVQAEDRAYRQGQKRCVNIHLLIAERTIDEKIASILDRKNSVLTSVADGEEAVDKELLITELITSIKGE